MSLWLALLWLAACALGFAVFILCRKRMADIGHDVGEEVDHRIRGILKAAREAEDQLRDAFADFRSASAAIQSFQKTRGKIPGIPRASPPWNWADADLDLLRKRSVADDTARRCRPPVVASIVGVLALTVGTAVATVILSNSAQPLLTTPAPLANAASGSGSSLPPPLSTPATLPTVPQAPAPFADLFGNPPNTTTQATGNGSASDQGGALFQPDADQGGHTQGSPTAPTGPASPAGGPPSPQDNLPASPQGLAAPVGSASQPPSGPVANGSNGVPSAKTIPAATPDPGQSGDTP